MNLAWKTEPTGYAEAEPPIREARDDISRVESRVGDQAMGVYAFFTHWFVCRRKWELVS